MGMRFVFNLQAFQVAFVLLVFQGCVTDPRSRVCQPSQQTIVDGGTTTTQVYTYESGKLKLMVSTTGSDVLQTSFEYNLAGDLGKSTLTSNGESMVTSYTHDIQHFLVASLFTFNGDTTQTTYVYNDVGQLVRENRTIVAVGSSVEETVHYIYPDLVTHNPSTIATVDLADSVVVHYEYDDKINPERGLFLPTIQAYNNITRVTAPTFTYTISYQYDGNGYPVSSTTSNGLTRTWIYACSEF